MVERARCHGRGFSVSNALSHVSSFRIKCRQAAFGVLRQIIAARGAFVYEMPYPDAGMSNVGARFRQTHPARARWHRLPQATGRDRHPLMLRQLRFDRIEGLENPEQGLADAEVTRRRARFGTNAIVAQASSGWLDIILETITDPMVWFLAGTAAIFLWLGDVSEAIVLIVALVPILGMDAYLHRRTQASTEGLSGRIASRANAIRNGTHVEIAADDLVPGDLVAVSAGGYFPADGLIVAGENLQADESTLTGEALPVRKRSLSAWPSKSNAVAVDGVHWGMAGTRLLTGEAWLRIVDTGAESLYGEIARLSQATHSERTPLQKAMDDLVRFLVVIALALCLVLAVVRYFQGYGLIDAVLSAVTLAVAALPEEFPVVFTFFLGVGVYRLAKHQALVRRAVVVENIGRVTCICTDKTGTLTEGQLALDTAIAAEGFDRDEILRVAASAARAESGDPLDLLLLAEASAVAGVLAAAFPFTEDRRREVTIIRLPEGGWRAAMKGAPETVIARSTLSAAERGEWRRRTADLAAQGRKVIAVAALDLDTWSETEPESGFRFLGLLAFTDPVRDGVKDAVRTAREAGVRIIMVTGDHAETAAAVARDIGIGGDDPKVLDGSELTARLDAGTGTGDIDVIARCIPSQKLALVTALQKEGELVAVTGDGVNDAPALRGADIGIAMGERGTRSAREVASIVLLDDNFGTIVNAMREGRQLFDNLKLSFAYLLMVHMPLVLTATIIPLLGYPLLYLPIHIVWLELIIHPTALLVYQNLPSNDGLSAARQGRKTRFFAPRDVAVIVAVGLVATVAIVWGYIFNLDGSLEVPHARSMALAVLVMASAAITAALSRMATRQAWIAVFATTASAVAAIVIEPLGTILHLKPLHLLDWTLAVAAAIVVGFGSLLLGRRKGQS
jgi:Ca2+-transporting ATPase